MKTSQASRWTMSRYLRSTQAVIPALVLLGSLTLLAEQQPTAGAHADTSAAASHPSGTAPAKQGPVLSSFEIAQGAILLHFDQTAGGVRLANPGRGAFEIAGADHIWFPAEGHLVNGVVVVSTSLVQQPTAVRYHWSSRKTAALFDSAEIPAAAFETGK